MPLTGGRGRGFREETDFGREDTFQEQEAFREELRISEKGRFREEETFQEEDKQPFIPWNTELMNYLTMFFLRAAIITFMVLNTGGPLSFFSRTFLKSTVLEFFSQNQVLTKKKKTRIAFL